MKHASWPKTDILSVSHDTNSRYPVTFFEFDFLFFFLVYSFSTLSDLVLFKNSTPPTIYLQDQCSRGGEKLRQTWMFPAIPYRVWNTTPIAGPGPTPRPAPIWLFVVNLKREVPRKHPYWTTLTSLHYCGGTTHPLGALPVFQNSIK